MNVPTGYIFVGWQSQDYKSVYTDATNKTINVQGIYEWKNKKRCRLFVKLLQPSGSRTAIMYTLI